MEKRIKYSQFQQVKSAAKMIDPNIRKIEALKKKIMPLVDEMKGYQAQNNALEAGIVSVLGFHVSELVKKVIEPTGKTDANGKPLTVTKYLPTEIVSYDEQKKEFVVTIPDAGQNHFREESSAEVKGVPEDAAYVPEKVVDDPSLEINEEVSEHQETEAEANTPWGE